jgi:hypothetical protein
MAQSEGWTVHSGTVRGTEAMSQCHSPPSSSFLSSSVLIACVPLANASHLPLCATPSLTLRLALVMASPPLPSSRESSAHSTHFPDLTISDAPLDSQHATSSLPSSSSPSISLLKRIADLLLWQDVLTSSLALSTGVLLVFLLQVCGYSLLTLLCYLSLLQLLICATFINGTRFFLSLQHQAKAAGSAASTPLTSAQPSPFYSSLDAPSADYSYVSQDLVLEYSGAIADSLNSLLHSLTVVLRCQSHWRTLQAAVALMGLSFVGRLMDGVTLCGLMWVGLFTVPKLYVGYKDEVDEQLSRVRAVVDGVREQVRRFLPEEDRKRKTE